MANASLEYDDWYNGSSIPGTMMFVAARTFGAAALATALASGQAMVTLRADQGEQAAGLFGLYDDTDFGPSQPSGRLPRHSPLAVYQRQPSHVDLEDVPAARLFGLYDDTDFGPSQPGVAPPRTQPQTFLAGPTDLDDLPAAALRGQPDEDFSSWPGAQPPFHQPLAVYQRQPLLSQADLEDVPAASLFGLCDDGDFVASRFAVALASPGLAPGADDSVSTPTPSQLDDDAGPWARFAVAPPSPQPSVDVDDVVAPLARAVEEDFPWPWQVARAVAPPPQASVDVEDVEDAASLTSAQAQLDDGSPGPQAHFSSVATAAPPAFVVDVEDVPAARLFGQYDEHFVPSTAVTPHAVYAVSWLAVSPSWALDVQEPAGNFTGQLGDEPWQPLAPMASTVVLRFPFADVEDAVFQLGPVTSSTGGAASTAASPGLGVEQVKPGGGGASSAAGGIGVQQAGDGVGPSRAS